jgi:hypothetical protein
MIRWLMDRGGPWRGFCQAALVQTPADLNEDHLVQALQALIDHHDALRMSVAEDGGLQIPPTGTVSARDCLTNAVSGEVTFEHAFSQGASRLDPRAGKMVQAIAIDGAAGERGRLLLVIHHLAVDAVSWQFLLADIAAAYAATSAGQPIRMPAKTTSFRHHALRLSAAAASRREEQMLWREQAARAVPPLVFGRLDAQQDIVATSGHIETEVAAPIMAQLVEAAARSFEARVLDVLLTALVLSAADIRRSNGDDDPAVRIAVEGHGREPLDRSIDLTRTVGWFTTVYPVRLT